MSGTALSRRAFIGRSAMVAGSAAVALGGSKWGKGAPTGNAGYGPLVEDPGGLIDLPRGFQYRVISVEGETRLTSGPAAGAQTPGDFDGMGAFPGPGDTTVLVRNQELRAGSDSAKPPVPTVNPYDPAEPGGTTGLIVAPNRKRTEEFVTNSGTRNNCAGGGSPWGTWFTCEEDRTTGHGYVFEVMLGDPANDLSKTPILDMGFFSHEAIDIDPSTNIAYLTEDDFRGAIAPDPADDTRSSFLFRFVPDDPSGGPGTYQKGGTLSAAKIDTGPSVDADFFNPGDRFTITWVDVDPAEPHDDALAKGAIRFNRLEGTHFDGGALWFDDTAGGEARLGQLFRYIPATNQLELFYEGTDASDMESPDNLIITPWGDLWFAEDGGGIQRVMGVTPEGEVYEFARNRLLGASGGGDSSEFAGPCFSPDGQTFFVNVQHPGHTFAIWGPFSRRNSQGARRMAAASPPKGFGPRISGELAAAADRLGLSHLEAAAFDRLGASLT